MSYFQNSNNVLLYRSLLGFALILLLVMAWNAPISGDEYVHVEQARKNIRYLQTCAIDKEALETPISRLKHYGQSFDTVTVYVSQLLGVKDLYRFRHLANAMMAWLIVLFTARTAFQISNSRVAAILAIVLILVSPRFMGHAMNNLKDIPFAFSFIFSIYFILKFQGRLPSVSWRNVVFIIAGIAFGISIRIGGLLIFAFFVLFVFLGIYFKYQRGELEKEHLMRMVWIMPIVSIFIFMCSYGLGILLWPWALESPFHHPFESLSIMKDYPTTVRQVFEGKLYWSDRFPWYYLFKYILISTPLLVLAGFISVFTQRMRDPEIILKLLFLFIVFGFPLFYAAATDANVYGGWRQLLFVFPPFVVLSAIGLWYIFKRIRLQRIKLAIATSVFGMLLAGPTYFIIKNYPYQYIYFNILAGGTYGAYGEYELDYYFTSFKKAYQYIDENLGEKPAIIAANFIIPEYYVNKPYKQALIDYYNRSATDWDYAIICNTFLDPEQLRKGTWPPENTVYTVELEGRPILAILKRETKSDLNGIQRLKHGDHESAILLLSEALRSDAGNESILLNLARAYFNAGMYEKCETTLSDLEAFYPSYEWIRDLRGELLLLKGEDEKAKALFRQNLDYNHKFFHSYVNLARTYLKSGRVKEAEEQLLLCLRINPFYEQAYWEYGKILIDKGEKELGMKMLNYRIEGNSKYGIE